MSRTIFLLYLCSTLSLVFSSTCNSCPTGCTSAANGSALCRCDADCLWFGDCCSGWSSSSCSPTELRPLNEGVKIECKPLTVKPGYTVLSEGEAYLMITACPTSWVDPDNSNISTRCTNAAEGQPFPPVTDIRTGVVYLNEFCARCNSVEEVKAWEMSLVCNNPVYDRLASTSISDLLHEDPDIFKNECSKCHFRPPSDLSSVPRQPRSCIPAISDCFPRWVLEQATFDYYDEDHYNLLVKGCTSGPIDLVQGDPFVYRNLDCAECNAEDVNFTECFELVNFSPESVDTFCRTNDPIVDPPSAGHPPHPARFAFTITLSGLANGQVVVATSSDSASISVNCSEGKVPVGFECRETLCPQGYSKSGGRCSYAAPTQPTIVIAPPTIDGNETSGSGEADNDTELLVIECTGAMVVINTTDFTYLENDTILLSNNIKVSNVVNYDELGRPIICTSNVSVEMPPVINCSSQLVALNKSEYVDLKNGSILYEEVVVIDLVFRNGDQVLVCPEHLVTRRYTFMGLVSNLPGLEEITLAGCSLSILGTIAVLVTYFIFSELHTFPGLVLMNLCVTFLATDLLFITGAPAIRKYPLTELCSALAITLHFFYLAQFSWMSIFSCEMLRNFYQASQFTNDSRRTKKRFFAIYLLIGWLPPLVISTISVSLNFSVDGLILYGINTEGKIDKCWINHYTSFIISFLVPLVLSLTCNLLMFILTTVLLCRASRDQSKVEKSNNGTIIRVWLAVFSITGLTWIFGFMAIFNYISWMWYLFIIFNSTHGFGVFLAFIVTKKVLNMYLDLFKGKRRHKNSLSFRNRSNASIRSNSSVSMQRRYTGSSKVSGSFRINGSFKVNGTSKVNDSFKTSNANENNYHSTTVSFMPNGRADRTSVKLDTDNFKSVV